MRLRGARRVGRGPARSAGSGAGEGSESYRRRSVAPSGTAITLGIREADPALPGLRFTAPKSIARNRKTLLFTLFRAFSQLLTTHSQGRESPLPFPSDRTALHVRDGGPQRPGKHNECLGGAAGRFEHRGRP